MMYKKYKKIKFLSNLIGKESTVFLVLIFILLFTSGCKQKKKEIDSKSLSFSFNTEFFHPPEKLPNFYLLKGWKKFSGEKDFSLIKKEGIIRFQVYKKQILHFKFSIQKGKRLKKIISPKIRLFLNDNFLTDIILTDDLKSYKIILQDKLLKEGDNFIKFKIVVNSLNKENYKRLKYNPDSYLKLGNFFISPKNGRITQDKISIIKDKTRFQRPNSKIYYYFYGNSAKKILIKTYYKGKSNHKLIMNILYESEKGEKGFIKKIQIHRKENKISIDLSKFNKETIYKLVFDLKGKADQGYIIWKKVILLSKHKKTKQKKDKFVLKSKPNIYYILLDALRYDVVGKKINNISLTPTINSFLKDSYEFKEFYAQSPYTRASVATLFTGLLPETHGVREISSQLPPKLITLQKILKNNGYYTSVIYGTEVLDTNNLIKDFDEKNYIRIFPGVDKIKMRNILNDISTMNKKLLSYKLKKLKNKNPKFVYIHLLPPHEPYNPPPSFKLFIDTSDYNQSNFVNIVNEANYFENIYPKFLDYLHKAYFNNVVYADFLVKRILKIIRLIGDYDDSIIIITADHGEAFFEHNKIGHNSTNYQEMIHIPFVIKLPNQEKKAVCYAKKGIVDILPTILELLGIENPNLFLQGKSFANCFTDNNCMSDKFLYSRTDDFNYNISVIWDKYKYINYFGRDELYNLNKDPKEKYNISLKYPFITGYLRQKSLEIMYKNIKLRNIHNIKILKKNFSKEEKKRLKSLGYL